MKELFITHKEKLVIAALCCIPLKLSWTYVILLPTILLWIIFCPQELYATFKKSKPLAIPLTLFFFLSILSSPFGLDPLTSIIELLRAAFLSLTALFILSTSNTKNIITYLFILICSQALAAVHTIIDGIAYSGIPRLFHGAVTESGQLALTIPMCFGLFIVLLKDIEKTSTKNYLLLLAVLNTICLVLCGLHFKLELNSIVFGSVLTLFLLTSSLSIFKLKSSYPILQIIFFTVITPLLMAALIVNLKRGPWSGIFIGSIFFFSLISLRFFIPFLGLAIASILVITPIRERLLYSSQHFFISGGRGEIWRVGAELIERFPLGIGYHNSSFMHQFSLEIPKELEHFHSNFINVLVETGWIGLFLYIGFLLSIALYVKNYSKDILTLALGTSLLSWQIAGLVEYNFGDSEVYIVALVALGLLLSRGEALDEQKNLKQTNKL